MTAGGPALGAIGLLADAVPSAVTVVEGDTIVAHNPAAELLYGHAASSAVGASFVDLLFDTDDRAEMKGVVGALLDLPVEGTWRVLRADGALLVSTFRLQPIDGDRFAWVATDAVDQGLAEQERAVLLSAEHAARTQAEDTSALLEAVLGAAPIGIAVFDLSLRYVRVNAALEAIDGLSAEEHLGRTVDELMLPPEVTADLRRVITTGRSVLRRTIVTETSAHPGEERTFSLNHYPVRSSTGAIIGAGSTVFDITEARRNEAARASLLRQAEEARQRLAVLATATSVMTTTLEAEELITRLARVLVPTVSDLCVIELVDDAADLAHVSVAARSRSSEQPLVDAISSVPVDITAGGPFAEVLRGGPARLFEDVEAIHDWLQGTVARRTVADLLGPLGLQTAIVAPIEARGRVRGRLTVAASDRVLGFDELDLAVEIAHRAALVLENADAFAQQRNVSEKLQRALLPQVRSTAGLELAVRYLAATDGAEVGGDWYDVIERSSECVDLVIGDVEGHDLDAAVAMSQIRSALNAYAHAPDATPSGTLDLVDQLAVRQSLRFSSCVVASIDTSAGTLAWSNAGHLPPVLLVDGEARLLEEPHDAVLGIGGWGRDRQTTEVAFPAGSVLVLYTDGAVERRAEELDVGLSRLRSAVATAGVTDPEALADAILEAMFPANQPRDDDVAILVARRPPAR